MAEDFKKPLNETIDAAKVYAEAKSNTLKLKSARGLSLGLSRFLTMLVIVYVLITFITLLAVTGALYLGQVLGSYALGCLIVTGVVFLILLLLIACRKKMFVNTFVKVFIDAFFPEPVDEDEEED